MTSFEISDYLATEFNDAKLLLFLKEVIGVDIHIRGINDYNEFLLYSIMIKE